MSEMPGRFLPFLTVVAMAALPAPPANAQGGGDITAGYTFVTNDMLARNASNLPAGWYTSGTVNLTQTLSIAWSATGAFNWGIEPSDSTEGVVLPGQREEFQGVSFHRPETLWCSPNFETCNVQIQSVLGGIGPRYTFQTGAVRPFVHFMAGWARVLRHIDFYTHTGTNFAIMPGGGFDIDVNDRFGLRVEGDYAWAFVPTPGNSRSSFRVHDGTDFRELRMGIGLIIKVGAWQ
jgi:hypothetical protein